MKNSISLTKQAHELIQQVLVQGDIAVDATVGNGHDTLFLAQTVGEKGKVYGFDIQQDALDSTYHRLQKHHVENRVSLFHAGHEIMPVLLPDHIKGEIKAAMFNLGYLPGGDKTRTTRISTTISALDAVLSMLKSGGRITILAYTEHPGGSEETEAVKNWADALHHDVYTVLIEAPKTRKPDVPSNTSLKKSPELIVIDKN